MMLDEDKRAVRRMRRAEAAAKLARLRAAYAAREPAGRVLDVREPPVVTVRDLTDGERAELARHGLRARREVRIPARPMRRRAAEAGVAAGPLGVTRIMLWLAGIAVCAAVGYGVMYWFGLHAWSGAVLGAAAWVVWTPCDE